MSVSQVTLERYIAFQLGDLGVHNEHHAFEEIATRIARRRISSNILVANGPVSAGGDQQRDAESYTTRIPSEIPNGTGFAASATENPVVVACTIQKTRLKQKIQDDLAGICAESARPVEVVAFFSVTSIPEATTHELQALARRKFGVTLDIFSGPKLSSLLAESDLVWIAQEYLAVPATMIPEPDEDSIPEWYKDALSKLRRASQTQALTTATQGEITRGMRLATYDDEARADLPEWVDFMQKYLSDDLHPDIVFRACYEIAVARFRGLGVAGFSEDLIRRALSIAKVNSATQMVSEMGTLIYYWGNMWMSGVGAAEVSEIADARAALIRHVSELLAETHADEYPVRATALTGTLASLHLQINWANAGRDGWRPPRTKVAHHAGERLDGSEVSISSLDVGKMFDLGKAMDYLTRLIDLMPNARSFALNGLDDVFTTLSPALSKYEGYVMVREAFDSWVAELEGDSAVAERCKDRALQFVKADQPLAALDELHRAKLRWFHGESIHGAIVIIRFIAKIYDDLDLSYAAKMYALAAAMMATTGADIDVKRLIPRALLEASNYVRRSGNWLDASALTEVALLSHGSLEVDAFDLDKHPLVQRHSNNDLLTLFAIRSFWPEVESSYSKTLQRTGWYEFLEDQVSSPEAEMPLTEEEFQELAKNQYTGIVLGDLGAQRTIDFSALGVRWSFTFDNTYDSVIAAEGLVAALQVILVDLAAHEPVIARDTVQVSVIPGGSAPFAIEDEADEGSAGGDSAQVGTGELWPDRFRWTVSFGPATKDFQALGASMTSVCLTIIASVHARPTEELLSFFERSLADALMNKMIVGRPYSELASYLEAEHYDMLRALKTPVSSRPAATKEDLPISASRSPGHGYDSTESLESITLRYRAIEPWSLSFTQFMQDDAGREEIQRLRGKGWLDWQIVAAFVNAGLNWRMRTLDISPENLDPSRMHAIALEPENDASELMPVSFVLEAMAPNLALQTAIIGHGWNLRYRSSATNGHPLRELMIRRYGYGTDDVPHLDLLECLDGDGRLRPLVA